MRASFATGKAALEGGRARFSSTFQVLVLGSAAGRSLRALSFAGQEQVDQLVGVAGAAAASDERVPAGGA